MKTITFFTAAALTLTTLPTFAQELYPEVEAFQASSTRSRADVKAELQAALDSGWRPPQGEYLDIGTPPGQTSMLTRADVRADLQAALDSGWRPAQGEAVDIGVPHRKSIERLGNVARDEQRTVREAGQGQAL